MLLDIVADAHRPGIDARSTYRPSANDPTMRRKLLLPMSMAQVGCVVVVAHARRSHRGKQQNAAGHCGPGVKFV